MHHDDLSPKTYGVMAEYATADAIVKAARRAREAGYRNMDAFTPFPIHALSDALDFHDNRVPWIVFLAGMAGAAAGFALQVYVSAIDYPMDVGGRPLVSTPAFLPVTFETTILLAGISAFLCVLLLNKLPMPYHPAFNCPNFDRASQDRFFLCVESHDKQFDADEVKRLLETTDAVAVTEVKTDAGYVEERD